MRYASILPRLQVSIWVLATGLTQQAVWAQTIDHSANFNSNGDLAKNGSANFVSPSGGPIVARLTTASNNLAGTFWHTSKVDIRFFTNTFKFQFSGGTPPIADGITFTIQNEGTTAKGSAGGGLGYGGIKPSVAVTFKTYGNGTVTPGYSTLEEGGTTPGAPASALVSPVDFSLEHEYQADMTYDGTALDVTITDTVTQKTHAESFAVNIPTAVGGTTAYVGFTGSTGGANANQDVLTWLFKTITPPPAPTGVQGTALAYPQGLYGEVQVQWMASPGAASYTIYRGPSSTGPWTNVGSSTTTSFVDTTSAQGQTYHYMVTASNLAGTSPDSAASGPVTTLVAPPQSPKRDKKCSCGSVSSDFPIPVLFALGLAAWVTLVFAGRR